MPAAACSSWSSFRELSITDAPASAIPAAIARPIPFDAPVTSATLPSNVTCMARESYFVDSSRSLADRSCSSVS